MEIEVVLQILTMQHPRNLPSNITEAMHRSYVHTRKSKSIAFPQVTTDYTITVPLNVHPMKLQENGKDALVWILELRTALLAPKNQ